jgi:hypothetical protein
VVKAIASSQRLREEASPFQLVLEPQFEKLDLFLKVEKKERKEEKKKVPRRVMVMAIKKGRKSFLRFVDR